MLQLLPSVWPDSIAQLRCCSSGRLECMVLWIGPLAQHEVVDAVVHPKHSATRWRYVIDPEWLHALHVSLYREGRTIRAQVHVHAHEAFHSTTDDRFPAVNTSGFLSLVLPRFARGVIADDEMWLAERADDGRWQRVPIADRITR